MKGEHLAARGLEHHGGAVVAEQVEAVLGGLLNVVIDGQPDALPLGRGDAVELAHLPPHAVDDDGSDAVLPHQHVVVRALEAGLADDVAALQPVVAGHLGVGHLADVPEHVRREFVGRVLPRRHLLNDDDKDLLDQVFRLGRWERGPCEPGPDQGDVHLVEALPVERALPPPLE